MLIDYLKFLQVIGGSSKEPGRRPSPDGPGHRPKKNN